jgi:putative NADH-flavin reductase
MTNICVFGADGRTGVEVVKDAVAKGHNVTAFIYDSRNAVNFDKKVKIICGNVLDYYAVFKAVADVDVVISVVGHIKGSDPRMQTKGIANIIKAMKKSFVLRLVSLTGTGVRVEGDKPSVIDLILNTAIKFIDPERIKDGIEHAEEIKKSDLDWTILRVLKLNDKVSDKVDYKLTEHGPAELTTSRSKVAKIMVDLATSDNFINKMPVSS